MRHDTVANTTKNIFYGTAGTYLPLAPSISISANAEVPVFTMKSFGVNLKGRLGYTVFGDFDGGSSGFTFATFSSVFLFGKYEKKFEVNLGFGTSANTSTRGDINGFIPTFGVAMRLYYEKKFIRFGVGFPEAFSFSYGVFF